MSMSPAVSSLDSFISHALQGRAFTFDPERVSDVTIHYQSASFHMHQYVLITQSLYFDALLSDAAESDESSSSCERCSRPSSAHHQCVSLEGTQIGGVYVSIDELNEFFRCVYAETNSQWRDLISENRQNGKWPSHFYHLKTLSIDVAKDEIVLDIYEIDGIRKHIIKGRNDASKILAANPIGRWFHSHSLHEHVNYHLADYFQCTVLLSKYVDQAQITALAATVASSPHPVWLLLILADRYSWLTVRKTCMEACAKDAKCSEQKYWAEIVGKMMSTIMAELFAIVVKSVVK